MARARLIKPGFYTNEQLAECSILARFIFPGLWQEADRCGRLEDRPKRIKAALLPYDDGDMDALLAELAAHGLIARYKVGQQRLIQIVNFTKHQHCHGKEPPSTLPEQEMPEASTGQAPGKHHSRPAVISNQIAVIGNQIAEAVKTVAAKDAAPPPKAPPENRKPTETGLPNGFAISDRVRRWAEVKGFTDLPAYFEAFVGRALAKPKTYRYTDWDQAFENFIREDWAGIRKRAPPSLAERRTAAVDQLTGQKRNGRDITGTAERMDTSDFLAIPGDVWQPDGDDVGRG